MTYFVYIVRCTDDTFYTGISNDVERRIDAHNEGVGAKYTRGRRPVTLVYHEECEDKSAALRREIEIKKLTKAAKLRLIKTSRK